MILAEIGLDMTRFPTAGHLVSWAKLSPRTIQSGAKSKPGTTGKGNPYLKGALGEAAAAAARTDSFLGERYRRIVKRRGKLRALVAVARSILVIIWHLLADPAARFRELGARYYASRTDTGRKTRNHVRQLEALGFTVTLPQPPDPAAPPATPAGARWPGFAAARLARVGFSGADARNTVDLPGEEPEEAEDFRLNRCLDQQLPRRGERVWCPQGSRKAGWSTSSTAA